MTGNPRGLMLVADDRGMCFRMINLMTHYRQPLNFSEARMAEAKKILSRWLAVVEPCLDGPPVEILEPLCNDLNGPAAIAAMHVMRKNGDGKKLFAAMRFLGFFDGQHGQLPDEWKTLPAGHMTFDGGSVAL
jgi:hypothetical protein